MNQFKKVAFHTLGCKLNFSETSTISRLFENSGFAKVDFFDSPDIFVINTCSVTNNADRECRMIVRKALKQNPEAFIAVIGCYAQLKPKEIASVEGVDIILGANEKFNLTDYIDSLEKKKTPAIYTSDINRSDQFFPSFSSGDRTRSFLKIQDGCDYFCSYCTIPLARGKSRSNSIRETVKAAGEAIATGAKEIVITGVNVGDFGNKQQGHPTHFPKGREKKISPFREGISAGKKDLRDAETFYNLLIALDSFPAGKGGSEDVRFRISSIEPDLLTDEIIEFVASSKRITPHFHIPLQSGSNRILKLMRRRYDSSLFSGRIRKIKSLIPDCCIGADVIVGFPGETEEDFLETYNFLNSLDISYLHVFTFSERVNTAAAKMKDSVPGPERSRRNRMLQILSEKKKRFFYEQHTGKTFHVLFEKENHGNIMQGFTENYIRVQADYQPACVNEIRKVILEKINPDGNFFARVHEYYAEKITACQL